MKPPSLTPKDIVPTGAFHFPVNKFKHTRDLGFLLLPEFTLLAFSAAVDPFRIANQLAQKPLYRWVIFSDTGAPVSSSSGVDVSAHHAIDDLPKDIRLLVCAGNRGIDAASDHIITTLRRHVRFGGTVGGICTGATTLARAGLLENRTFTLHWENQPAFIETFPDLSPTSNRYEIDDDLWTCGGGVAATEMMLSVIEQDYGADFAVAVSDMCLNTANSATNAAQRSSLARALSTRNQNLIQAVQDMHDNIEDPLSLEELAARAGLSRRQLERHFRQFLGDSPMNWYRNIRLDRARVLIVETDMAIVQIAIASGFNSVSVFTRHYKNRFGSSPSTYFRNGNPT
jgi:transcriptional regulator GlxA family with amidase domain